LIYDPAVAGEETFAGEVKTAFFAINGLFGFIQT
jgi:hypothetical protein